MTQIKQSDNQTGSLERSILLINPPWHQKSNNMWKYIKACMPPFGLGQLAAVLEQNGNSVQILDTNAHKLGLDVLKDHLPGGPFCFIGITATTGLFPNALETARVCKERFPETPVIMGGVHPSVLPEEALSTPWVDFVVRHEGEETLIELINGVPHQDIQGLSYKDNGVIVGNPDRPPRENISDLPMIPYHLLPMNLYKSALGSYIRQPSIGMVVSRGCPGRCTYCYGKYLGNRVRFRTAEQIVEEIEFLMANYGIREISFYDDTFTTYLPLVELVCETIIERKLDITWSCFARVDMVSEKALVLMKQAGCHQIMYGIESGDTEILKNINKNIDLVKAMETIRLTRKTGINVRLAYMLGNPGETPDTIKKTIQHAIKADPDFAVFNITTPFPGSAMFEWADSNGHLLTKDWGKYDLATIVMHLPTLEPHVVQKYYRKAYRRFYLRWHYLWKRLIQIRSITDLKMNYYAFKALLNF